MLTLAIGRLAPRVSSSAAPATMDKAAHIGHSYAQVNAAWLLRKAIPITADALVTDHLRD